MIRCGGVAAPPFRPALLAFDLDGTLIPEQDRHLSAETSTILREWYELGVKIAVITGRDTVTERMRREGFLSADAANNGATIDVGAVRLHSEVLAESDVNFLVRHGLPFVPDAEHPTAFIFSEAGYAVPDDGTTSDEWREQYRVSFLTPEHARTAFKVLYSHPQAAAYADHLRATQPHLSVTGGMEPYLNFVSVTPANATKSTALRRIAQALGVPMSRTVAFGDSDNDADLLETAAFAVQIGNHPHLTPHADVRLPEQAELNGYLRRMLDQFKKEA